MIWPISVTLRLGGSTFTDYTFAEKWVTNGWRVPRKMGHNQVTLRFSSGNFGTSLWN